MTHTMIQFTQGFFSVSLSSNLTFPLFYRNPNCTARRTHFHTNLDRIRNSDLWLMEFFGIQAKTLSKLQPPRRLNVSTHSPGTFFFFWCIEVYGEGRLSLNLSWPSSRKKKLLNNLSVLSSTLFNTQTNIRSWYCGYFYSN